MGKARPHSLPSQAGVALILSLVLLLILSSIGIYMGNRSMLQQRMASNAMSLAEAFENAEAARLTAEAAARDLADNLSAGLTFNCNRRGFFAAAGVTGTVGQCSGLDPAELNWGAADSIAADRGRYAIEYQGRREVILNEDRFTLPITRTEVHGFRVVTFGQDPAGGTSILETVYLRRSSG